MNLNKSKIQKIWNLKEFHIPNTYGEILNEAEIIGIILGDGHVNLKGGYIRIRVNELDFCKNFSVLIKSTYKIDAKIDNKYYLYGIDYTIIIKNARTITYIKGQTWLV